MELNKLLLFKDNEGCFFLTRKTLNDFSSYIKSKQDVRGLPVIFSFPSISKEEKTSSHRKKADFYISKPLEVETFNEAIFSLKKIAGALH